MQFLASATTKTLVGTIYGWEGQAIVEATLTATTTARQADYQWGAQGAAPGLTGPGLWTVTNGGAVLPWSDDWAGFVPDTTASASVYVKESKGVAVTSTNGRTVAVNMPIGVVPQRFYDVYYGASGSGAGGATAAKQDTGNTTLGLIQNANDGLNILYNGAVYPILHAVINPSTINENTAVAAVAAKKILVVGYSLMASGTVNVQFKDDASGNVCSMLHYLVANTGITKDITGKVLFGNSAVNKPLIINLSAGVAVGCDIWYITV